MSADALKYGCCFSVQEVFNIGSRFVYLEFSSNQRFSFIFVCRVEILEAHFSPEFVFNMTSTQLFYFFTTHKYLQSKLFFQLCMYNLKLLKSCF